MDDDALTRRALAAYYRMEGEYADAPSRYGTGVVVHDDKVYVRVVNSLRTLAVYRVRNDGILKRLRRWPKAVEEW